MLLHGSHRAEGRLHTVDGRRLRGRTCAEASSCGIGIEGMQRLHQTTVKLVGRRAKQAPAAQQDDEQLGQCARKRRCVVIVVIVVIVVVVVVVVPSGATENVGTSRRGGVLLLVGFCVLSEQPWKRLLQQQVAEYDRTRRLGDQPELSRR